jgi:hypothetical protein
MRNNADVVWQRSGARIQLQSFRSEVWYTGWDIDVVCTSVCCRAHRIWCFPVDGK